MTNDFQSVSSGGKEKSRALNMVIKLNAIAGEPCVKISDELMKVREISCTFHCWHCVAYGNRILHTSQNTGDPAAVQKVKGIFNINV